MTISQIIIIVLLSPVYLAIALACVSVVILSWIFVLALLGNKRAKEFTKEWIK